MNKKNANILLLSDKEYEYQTLVDAGYKNVFWFKSGLRAYEYFKDREDELRKFDIILMGSRAISHFNCEKYDNPFVHVTFWDDDVEKINFFTGYCEEETERLFFISHPNVTSLGVPKEQFLSILNDVIPDELKDEKISLCEIKEKDVILPKEKNKVKVLLMGYAINNELVENVFREAGFTNYEYIQSSNFSLEKNIEKLADYDLVVVDSMYNGRLTLMGDEFQDYMKDKGKSIYFVVYDYRYRGMDTNEFWIKGLSTCDPDKVESRKFKSLENEEDALKDVIRTVINLYASFNKNMGDTGYPSVKSLNEKYQEKWDEKEREYRRINNNIFMISSIQRNAFDYRRLVNQGHKKRKFTDFVVDILSDGVSVAFLVRGREAVRVTFLDKDKTPGNLCKQFYLEFLSEKGKMMPLMVRSYYEYPNPEAKIENMLSEEELRKLDAIYKRLCEQLVPVVNEMNEEEKLKTSKEVRRNNRVYNKVYKEDKKSNLREKNNG